MTRTSALVCGLCLFCSAPVHGQGISLGIKGGANISAQRFEGEAGPPSVDWHLGVVAGMFARLPVLSWLDLQPEALYAPKGARVVVAGTKSSVLIDYFEVPILLRVAPVTSRTRRYFVAGGPSIGFRLRARSRTQFLNSTEEIDIGNDLERLDFGVAVGGGVERGSLVLDGRYTFGLKDIDKDKTDTVKVTNRTFSVTVGLKF